MTPTLLTDRRRAALVGGGLALLLGACTAGEAAEPATAEAPADAGVRVVSVEEAASLLATDPAPTLLDVRTPGEYAEGHLEGAVLVDYNAPDFREQVAALPRDASYVIYCRSGNRSAGARAVMTDLGFTDVADIEGGIVAWVGAGQSVTG